MQILGGDSSFRLKLGGDVAELYLEWGGDNIVSLGLGGGNKFFQSSFVSVGGTLLSKKFCMLHA